MVELNPGLICQISYLNQSFLDYGRVTGAYKMLLPVMTQTDTVDNL